MRRIIALIALLGVFVGCEAAPSTTPSCCTNKTCADSCNDQSNCCVTPSSK